MEENDGEWRREIKGGLATRQPHKLLIGRIGMHFFFCCLVVNVVAASAAVLVVGDGVCWCCV